MFSDSNPVDNNPEFVHFNPISVHKYPKDVANRHGSMDMSEPTIRLAQLSAPLERRAFIGG
jgi:hypothetical protein